jgi:hypothetical protein
VWEERDEDTGACKTSVIALLLMTVTGCATMKNAPSPSASPRTGSTSADQLAGASHRENGQAP